jgi:exportin-1
VKQDWPHDWPNFVVELISYAQITPSMCENAMIFLRVLSEDIFDFSFGRISATRIDKMKLQLITDFPDIFKLIIHVLEKSQEESLGLQTLETLYALLSWIPISKPIHFPRGCLAIIIYQITSSNPV